MARNKKPPTVADYLNPLEKDVQAAILEALQFHPLVAWAARMNTGAAKFKDAKGKARFVRFGFPGMSDIIGQFKDGTFLAIEAKRPKGEGPTDDQKAFMETVNNNGGRAGVARSVDDIDRIFGGDDCYST